VITVVSGLPRSGTSMMMQMLAAGGMPILTDNVRQPDQDNPRGYLEWEPVARLAKEPELIEQAEGKAVKVISRLLQFLSPEHEYKMIFMRRPMSEVMQSQEAMCQHRGASMGAGLDLLQNAIGVHIRETEQWCTRQKNITLLTVWYDWIVHDPRGAAETIAKFLPAWLYVKPMADAVDPSLYRNRQVTSVLK
jgi:hypothetical protein